MRDLVERTLRFFNPYHGDLDDRDRRGRMTVLLSLFVLALLIPSCVSYWAMAGPAAAAELLLSTILFSANLFVFRRTKRVDLAAHGFSVAAFIAFGGTTLRSGGLHASALGTAFFLPMLAAILAGRRAATVWAVLSSAFVGVVLALDIAGVEFASAVPQQFEGLMKASGAICSIAIVSAAMFSLEAARDEATAGMVAARDDAMDAHASARLVLDEVAEGLAVIDQDGRLGAERSAAFDAWFEVDGADAKIWDVLGKEAPSFGTAVELAWEQYASNVLPPELALEQLPRRLDIDERTLCLSWKDTGRDGRVMLVATDITEQLAAEAERAEREELMAIVNRLTRDRTAVVDFVANTSRTVEAIVARDGTATQDRRWLHTLKGNSSIMGLDRLARWIHGLEDTIAERGGAFDETQRRALQAQWAEVEGRIGALLGDGDAATVPVQTTELDRTIKLVVAGEPRPSLAARMEAWMWDRVEPRLELLGDQARRLAERLDKSIDVTIEANGLRTPPDERWSEFWAAMAHVVRNAVDHGIEPDREALGKPLRGSIRLTVDPTPGGLRVEVSDDGAGIDWDRIGERARHLGLPFDTDEERLAAMFADGVTTRDAVTETSGRGVGSSAILQATRLLGGIIEVESEPGRSTRFAITIPLVANVSPARVSLSA